MRRLNSASFKRLLGGLDNLTLRLWVPIRQMGRVASLRPDWDTAPSNIPALTWYAAVVMLFLAAGRIVVLDPADLTSAGREVVYAAHAFLQYTLSQAFYVCVFAAIGRWFVFWDCMARKSSPVQLLGMTYTVSAIDQVALLVIRLTTGEQDGNSVLLGVKDLASMALALIVLIDFFRPRPPTRPRRTKARTLAPMFGETASGKV